MAHDVFISFSTEDKPIADAACAVLVAQRIRCWIAPRDVQLGIPFFQSIMEGIRGSRVLVLILSARSNISKHVLREVTGAFNREIPVVPFRIEDVSLSDSLEYLVGSLHWLDALTPPLERHLETLARRILALLAESGGGEESARPPGGKDGLTKGHVDRAPAAPSADSPPSTSDAGTYSKAKAQGADGLKPVAEAMPAEVLEAARLPGPDPAPSIQEQPAVPTQLLGAARAPTLPPTQPGREWTNSIGIKLVRIEPGSFLMGSSKEHIDHLLRCFPGYDLRLMSSESDVSRIPTSGQNLVIVADVKGVLHFRIFDADGKVVVDADATSLTTKARSMNVPPPVFTRSTRPSIPSASFFDPIADLKKKLDSLWPPTS